MPVRAFGLIAFILSVFCMQTFAQTGVLNPDDPIVVYNPNNPPATPPFGQLAKWVKTNRLSWNTSSYKAYILNGLAFRLKFPKTYKDNINNPNKKYPLYIFWHGIGEKGTIYDNEYQLYHGGQSHRDAVDNGTFDGFLLYPQASSAKGFFGAAQFQTVYDLINNFLIPQAKVDPFRIVMDGLSGGGTATWSFLYTYPTTIAAALPLSAATTTYSAYAERLKYNPIWHFQGGLDKNPPPQSAQLIADSFAARGANYKLTIYPQLAHGVWNDAWAEPNYYPFLNNAYKSNPYVLFGRTEYCQGSTINSTMGVTAGFDHYEWRRNGSIIATDTNQITATEVGVYDCRVQKGTTWSEWSPIPVEIKVIQYATAPTITKDAGMSAVLPDLGNKNSVVLRVPDNYNSYQWEKVGNPTVLSTADTLLATSTGNYQIKIVAQSGCASLYSAPFTVVNANGSPKPDPAINLSAVPDSKTSLVLNWSENPSPAFNETAYEVYSSKTAGGPYTYLGQTVADVTTYSITGLESGATYYFKVRAVNGTGAAAASNEAVGTTDADLQAPTAPETVSVFGTSRNYVALKWGASIDDVGVEYYDIYINGVKSYVTRNTYFIAYNLNPLTSYNIVVKARDAAGNVSPASNQVTAQTVMSGLIYKYYEGEFTALPNFNALEPNKVGAASTVTLTPAEVTENYAVIWQGYINIPTTGSYRFYITSDDGSRLYIGNYDVNATPLVDNDGLHGSQTRNAAITLTAGVHPFTVTYFQGTGGQTMSVSWRLPGSNTTVAIPASQFVEPALAVNSLPAKPTNLAASVISYRQVNLSWTDNSNNETNFELFRATDANGPFTSLGRLAANTTSFTDTFSVAPSTQYFYKVRAINSNGESEFDKDGPGVNYSYIEQTGMSTVPDFTLIRPVLSGRSSVMNTSVSPSADNYALQFEGYINITTAGNYTFFTRSDDGSRLWINGTQVVNNDGLHGSVEVGGTINLPVGYHKIRVGFFEATGGELLEVRYQLGSTVPKQIIPASVLGVPNVTVTTAAAPPVPAVPGNFVASGVSSSKILISWDDNSANETSFELYRSSNNNANYVLLKTLPANTVSYEDQGLFGNATYFYKIRAINEGGASEFAPEASAQTSNSVPVVGSIPTQYKRFDEQLVVPVSTTDAEGDLVSLSVSNLPAFASFTNNGNGTGSITFASGSSAQQNTYSNITITATDPQGGTSNMVFNLIVNNNHTPTISAAASVSVNENSTVNFTLNANDADAGDVVSWTFENLPSFATVTPNNRSAQVTMSPGFDANGSYKVKVRIEDGNNGVDTSSFTIIVNDVNPSNVVRINFTAGNYTAGTGWNNTTKAPASGDTYPALKTTTGATTTWSLSVVSPWQNQGVTTNDFGSVTGNNSGIYPDNVMRTNFYLEGTPQTLRISGLTAGNSYNFTFFASRANISDARITQYSIGGTTVELSATNNSQNTVTISNVIAPGNGQVDITLTRKAGSSYGYISAMVIESQFDNGSAPAKPRDLAVSFGTGKANLTWTDAAFNETGYRIYRSTVLGGPYTAVLSNGAANLSSFADSTTGAGATYYYYVQAFNGNGNSPNSDTVSVTTPNAAPVLATIQDVSLKANQILDVAVSATDVPGDVITLSGVNLPSFITLNQSGNGTGNLHIDAGTNLGTYNITVQATDNHGLSATTTFKVVITDPNLKSYYLNFNGSPAAPAPWNNLTGYSASGGLTFNNLKDETGATTSTGLVFVDPVSNGTSGAQTGNNSGVYPDLVMRNGVYIGSNNAANSRVRLTGLSTSKRYNLVMFGSFTSTNQPYYTVYNAGGVKDSLAASANTTRTVRFVGLAADASGNLEFTFSRGAGQLYGFLNSLVIEEYDANPVPKAPTNLVASAKSKTSIQLNWLDNSYNETGYEIYRSTSASGTFSLITTTAASATSYTDQGLTKGTTYFYKVRGKNTPFFSAYSNVAQSSTYAYTVYINLTKDDAAGGPWNNTLKTPEEEDVFGNLKNDDGNPSGLSMRVVGGFGGDNPWGTQTGNNSGVYPDAVLHYSWWVDAGATGTLYVSGLNQAYTYSFTLLGSRSRDGSSRLTKYTVNGKVVYLEAGDNTMNTITIDQVQPDANGEVRIDINNGPGSSYGYLNSIVLSAYYTGTNNVETLGRSRSTAANQLANSTLMGTGLSLDQLPTEATVAAYPNPFRSNLTVSVNLPQATDEATLRIVDMRGGVVYSQQQKNLPAGTWVKEINLAGLALKKGMYILQFFDSRQQSKPVNFQIIKMD